MGWATTSIGRHVHRRCRTSRTCRPSTWGADMDTKCLLVCATLAASATVGVAAGGPIRPLLGQTPPAVQSGAPLDEPGIFLVQGGGRGGGPRAGGGARASRGGGFNSNDFHRNVSNTQTRNAAASRNVAANRNVNVNANRNVAVVGGGGGCCYGNYNSGPSWGGVAAGVAVGAMVGAAANSAASSTYAPPPPTYPPGYVTPPPY